MKPHVLNELLGAAGFPLAVDTRSFDVNRSAAMSLALVKSKQAKTDLQQLFCQYIGCCQRRVLATRPLNYSAIKQVSHDMCA